MYVTFACLNQSQELFLRCPSRRTLISLIKSLTMCPLKRGKNERQTQAQAYILTSEPTQVLFCYSLIFMHYLTILTSCSQTSKAGIGNLCISKGTHGMYSHKIMHRLLTAVTHPAYFALVSQYQHAAPK